LSLQVSGLPAGVSATLVDHPIAAPGAGQIVIAAGPGAQPGVYPLSLSGLPAAAADFTLEVAAELPSAPALSQPPNEGRDADLRPPLSWSPAAAASDYSLQIARDADFRTVVASASGLEALDYIPTADLAYGGRYFWRVQARNACGVADSAVGAFTVRSSPLACGPGSAPSTFYREDFDAAAAGWTGGESWRLVSPGADGSAQAYLLDLPASSGERALVSPGLQVPAGGSPLAHFWQRRQLEGAPGTCRDAAVVEVSTDGGSSWQSLGTEIGQGGYNGAAADGNPLAGQAAWCGSAAGERVVIDLSAYAGETVQLRFRAASDGSGASPVAWMIDSLALQACVPGPDFDFSVEAPAVALQAPPGYEAVYNMTVTNQGNAVDELAAEVLDSPWPVRIDLPGALDPGATAQVRVVVQVPAEIEIGAEAGVALQVTSVNDPSSAATVNLTVTAGMYEVRIPFVNR
jgi:hypothetical protein